jgi:5-dehydro-4-deoxyglucarate dehydratase
VDAGPGGVFIACGTGEFHALEPEEFGPIVRTAVEVVAGRVPVYAGAGGSIAQAKQFARAAKEAGADGLLLLPPYLVEMPQEGLIAYVRAVAATTDLPVIVYNRNNARFVEESAIAVSKISNVIGFKDGTGDLDNVARIVHAVTTALNGEKDFLFFNGMPTAETTQQAYRAVGVPLYSSATFAFAPDLALAFYNALETGNEELANALLREFFHPLVRLRDTVPGYAVSLVKAGVTFEGIPAGPVRPPLIMPSADDLTELRSIIDAGRAVLADALTEAR